MVLGVVEEESTLREVRTMEARSWRYRILMFSNGGDERGSRTMEEDDGVWEMRRHPEPHRGCQATLPCLVLGGMHHVIDRGDNQT